MVGVSGEIRPPERLEVQRERWLERRDRSAAPLDFPSWLNLSGPTLIHNAQHESKGQPERLRYNYFTAGSGGAGPGVFSTSFYLIVDEAVTYKNGKKINLKPYNNMLNIDFGKRDWNVTEVASAHEIFKVPTINARFGIASFFWNWTLSAFIKTMPVELLKNRNIVQVLVKISYPLIRAVDIFSGKRAAIRVDLQCSDGYNSSAIFSHERLSEATGTATAAFVLVVLEGSTMLGDWYPNIIGWRRGDVAEMCSDFGGAAGKASLCAPVGLRWKRAL
ncbi:hypothetical protein CASFOL_037268 [Castilleja foliolosa]|uniref:Uncharacterized protein n=1 Tax=Castilleja foliolosa TaxID=1961234 RepID=A0ABD3BNN2_9LAMI